MTHVYRLSLCLIFMALGCPMSGLVRAGEVPALFLSIPPGQFEPSSARILVGIDFSAISPGGTAPPAITIRLPDRTITALKQGGDVRGRDDYSWRGTVAGFELSTVILTVKGRTVYGHIDFDTSSYSIESKDGAYLVTRKDPSRRAPLGDDTRIPGAPDKRSGD